VRLAGGADRAPLSGCFLIPVAEIEKAAVSFETAAFAFGGESGIRTPDLRIMIPSL
jgi:hypothetical protein